VDLPNANFGLTRVMTAVVLTPAVLNLQTGCYNMTIEVTNNRVFNINGFRLHVNFNAYLALYPSLTLNYKSGADPLPYIDYPFPVVKDGKVTMTLEFCTTNRRFPSKFDPILTVDPLCEGQVPNSVPYPGSIPVVRCDMLKDRTILLEFETIPCHWYRIQYSNGNLQQWYDSPVPIFATGTKTQFIDNGAPATDSHPSTKPSRFYRVREIPGPPGHN
jgi:hypothetical protein